MASESTTPTLVVIKGPMKNTSFSLTTNLVTLGRVEDADICLTGDTSLSRIHLNLKLVNGRYFLVNRSDNGTRVNDKIAVEQELHNGDRIRIGDVYLLEFSDGSKPAKERRSSMFLKPKMMIFGGLYAMALIGAAIFLSSQPSQAPGVNGDRVSSVLEDYRRTLVTSGLSQEDQEARRSVVQSFLRTGFIAEREGNYAEARRTYLTVLDYTKDGKNPAYQYALERLRSMPSNR